MKKEWFTQIPNSLIKIGKLNVEELGLYTYYKSFSGEDGYCNVTQAKVSKDLQLSTTTYRKIRDSLIEKGYIRLDRLSQKRLNVYIEDIWQQNIESFNTYKESNMTQYSRIESKCDIEEEPILNNLYKEDSIINENSFELLDGVFVGEVVKEPYIESNMTHSEQCHTVLFDVRQEIEMNEPILEKKTYPRTDSEFLNKALDEIEKGVPVPVVTSRYFVYKNEILDIIGKYPLTN